MAAQGIGLDRREGDGPSGAEAKICQRCGSAFTRPKRVGMKLFASRRYCSRTCRDDAATKSTPRNCEFCGAKLPRRVASIRKYCDRKCMAAAFLARPKKPSPGWAAAHSHARKICPAGACARCGRGGRTDVHHIDENWQNNTPANLERLCRGCHLKEHQHADTPEAAARRQAAIQKTWATRRANALARGKADRAGPKIGRVGE